MLIINEGVICCNNYFDLQEHVPLVQIEHCENLFP